MKLLSALALFLASFLASAQTSPADALRGPSKKISVSELPPTYRAVVFGTNDINRLYGLASIENGNSDRSLTLYGLLGTSFVDPDEFAALLDGKLPRIRAYTLDLASMARTRPTESSQAMPTPLFTESWIESGRVVQWSPRPEITRDSLLAVFGQDDAAKPAADITRTVSNAKQVALAMVIYSGDADDVFPYANSTAQAQHQVEPYTKSMEVWKSYNPNGGRLLYNTALSGVSQTQLPAPAETLMVWDEQPWPDGRRVVAYADGHASIVTADQWSNSVWPAEERRRTERKRELARVAAYIKQTTGAKPRKSAVPRSRSGAPRPK